MGKTNYYSGLNSYVPLKCNPTIETTDIVRLQFGVWTFSGFFIIISKNKVERGFCSSHRLDGYCFFHHFNGRDWESFFELSSNSEGLWFGHSWYPDRRRQCLQCPWWAPLWIGDWSEFTQVRWCKWPMFRWICIVAFNLEIWLFACHVWRDHIIFLSERCFGKDDEIRLHGCQYLLYRWC